jgi:hypothetical protein
MPSLLSIFPKLEGLLSTAPEDLAAILIELWPQAMQNGMVNLGGFIGTLYGGGQDRYPVGTQKEVLFALAEAMSWLETQGLIMQDPSQFAGGWYVKTRRGEAMKTRVDVTAYARGRILPEELLPPLFLAKVLPLFRRGDHDVAVFQAFKEVEVATRKAANAKGAGYPDSEVGTKLMRKAFHPDTGALTDSSLVPAEREAEMHLFSGAIGHAKNPAGHRDYDVSAAEAARLIIFASYLLAIIEGRR